MSQSSLFGWCVVGLVLAGSMFGVGCSAEESAPETSAEEPIQQQFERIEELQRSRPTSAEEFLERQAQVQEIADKILAKAEKGSEDYQKAYMLSRTARVRTLSLVEEEEQNAIAKLLMDEVKAKKAIELTDAQLGMALAQGLELSERNELAGKAYLLYGELLAKSDNDTLADVSKMFLGAGRRLTLIGEPMKLTGTTVEGKQFDLTDWNGKVVLVDFWATWCGPCIAEYPNILMNYEKYHDRGFEVVGVSLDQNRAALESYLKKKNVPWPTLHDEENGGQHPAASYYGISGIPAMFLIGKDGNVVSLSARGPQLNRLLADLLGPTEKEKAPDTPKADEDASTATDLPLHLHLTGHEYFVSAPAAEDGGAEESGQEATDTGQLSERNVNPYSAAGGMSTAQLVDYIFNMEEKPRSVQERPGFADALIEASERLIAKEKTGVYWRLGVLSKFKYLHQKASQDDKQAQKQLAEYIDQMKDAQDKRIAKEVRFLTLERKVLNADELPLEEIPELLAQLDEYFSNTRLNERHLRMASATIHAVNRLDSEDEKDKDAYLKQREKHFTSFGELFAKSTDRELSQYGKKLAKKSMAEESDLVGKPLELKGTTFAGSDFDWSSYRGKVVLVDFWATWCGPCIREMPNVRALYDENKDKGFAVVGVSLDRDLVKLGQFLEDNKVPWTNLAGEGTAELAKKYEVRGIPTMMLVDREGKIVGVAHNVAALRKMADQLLAKAEANSASG